MTWLLCPCGGYPQGGGLAWLSSGMGCSFRRVSVLREQISVSGCFAPVTKSLVSGVSPTLQVVKKAGRRARAGSQVLSTHGATGLGEKRVTIKVM